MSVTVAVIVAVLAAVPLLPLLSLLAVRFIIFLIGYSLRSRSKSLRDAMFAQSRREKKAFEQRPDADEGWEKVERANGSKPLQHSEWEGIVGFFHPFCNAGGGGERVLWAAVAATQRQYPRAVCVVYTGDHNIERPKVVKKVRQQFEIILHEPTLHFIYLSQREFVLPSTYPHFTLLGQSLGSLILAFDAFSILVPDIFIDTMGYAFAVALCRFLFPKVTTAAYVHYPTISTDMLESLDDTTGTKGIHSGRGTGWKGKAKKLYWRVFAWIYGWVGRQIDVVMCNSSWTSGHITQLWKSKDKSKKATVLYPPCPVTQVARQIPVSAEAEKMRENIFLYIAQFRPEKNHFQIMTAFAKYLHSLPKTSQPPRLVLIGSVRTNTPDERHIYRLRLEARSLKIDSSTMFITDAPFDTIMLYLKKASVGVNGMYSEHFGIGNVEGQAAGLILVCHNSGGPKLDICVPLNGQPTGFLAETEDDYAEAFKKIGSMTESEIVAMRLRARESANRFTDELFAEKWIEQMGEMVDIWNKRNKRK